MFLRALLVILVVLVVAFGGIVLLAHAQGGYTGSWLTFSLCKLPCWRGITPGVTSLAVTKTRLGHMTDIKCCDDPQDRFIHNLRFQLTSEVPSMVIDSHVLGITADDGSINSLYFEGTPGMVRFQMLTKWLGPPDTVDIKPSYQDKTLIILNYQSAAVVLMTEVSSATLARLCQTGFDSLTIDTILLHRRDNATTWPGDRWRGYGSLSAPLCNEAP